MCAFVINVSVISMRKIFYSIIGLCLLASCASNSENEVVNNAIRVVGDSIIIDSEDELVMRLKTQKVERSLHEVVINTTGEVVAIPSAYAEVAAPFSGRVTKTLAHLGQSVSVGTPLFELSSSDYSEVVKNYLQSASQLEVAKNAMNRAKDLFANKVASAKDVEDAQNNYNRELEEYRHAVAVAKEYQIDLKHAEVGQPMVVRSPIGGKVLSNELVMGEYLKEDAEAKVVVADLRKVWVKVNVTEMEAPLMNNIENIEVRLVSDPDSVFGGKIAYMGGMLSAESRTMQTIIECDNSKGRMMPNMYAKIVLKSGGKECVMVPKKAVLQGEDGRYVFRKVADNKFVRTLVVVQTADEENMIVLDGLTEGDEIITDGAFYLIDQK